jgi:hypothetical protein
LNIERLSAIRWKKIENFSSTEIEFQKINSPGSKTHPEKREKDPCAFLIRVEPVFPMKDKIKHEEDHL